MKIDRDFAPTAAQQSLAPMPAGIQKLVQNFQVDFKEWIDDVKEELKGVTDPDEAEVIRYKMETPVARVSGKAGRDLMFDAEGNKFTKAWHAAKTEKAKHAV